MSGDVIVTVTLNAALHVAYTADDEAAEGIIPVSRPGYRAGGRGVTVARVLRAFGHDVLAAGLAGGASGELIIQDLAKSGVPTAFTLIRGESRRLFRFTDPDPRGGPVMRFGEPGPYITTEELGRFAADYRRLLAGAAAVVLCGSLPDGLPADTYGSLVTYAAEAGVPVILDAGGEELKQAVGHGPNLVVAEGSAAEPGTGGFGAALIRLGAAAAAVAAGIMLRGFAPNPPPLMKCAQNTAQVSRIQFKFFAQFRSCGLLAVGEFVEHADFTQGQRTVEQPFLQNTDLPRVEAIEAPDSLNALTEFIGTGRAACHEISVGRMIDFVNHIVAIYKNRARLEQIKTPSINRAF